MDNALEKIIKKLNSLGKMKFCENATNEQIALFESDNNITLPTKYKEYLRCSDGGECFLPAGVQFYGVAHKPLINVADNDRPNDKYIVIGALSFGDPILFKKGSEQICIYNHEAGKIEKDEIFEDFYSFLDKLPEILGIDGK